MWRLLKVLVFLLVLGAIAFVGYGYVGPIFMRAAFEAPTERVTETITLELQ